MTDIKVLPEKEIRYRLQYIKLRLSEFIPLSEKIVTNYARFVEEYNIAHSNNANFADVIATFKYNNKQLERVVARVIAQVQLLLINIDMQMQRDRLNLDIEQLLDLQANHEYIHDLVNKYYSYVQDDCGLNTSSSDDILNSPVARIYEDIAVIFSISYQIKNKMAEIITAIAVRTEAVKIETLHVAQFEQHGHQQK